MARRTFVTCPDTGNLSLVQDCHKCGKLIQINYRTKEIECEEGHGKPFRKTEMLSGEEV